MTKATKLSTSITLLSLALAFPGAVESWSAPKQCYRQWNTVGLRQRAGSISVAGACTPSLASSGHNRRHGDLLVLMESSRKSDQQSSSSSSSVNKNAPLTKLSVFPTEYAEDTAVSSNKVSSTATDNDKLLAEEMDTFFEDERKEYKRGLAVIMFITFLFAANSPLAHAVFSMADKPPPVLLVNAGAAIAALCGLFIFRPILEGANMLESPSSNWEDRDTSKDIQAGLEMGLCKTIGATVNFYGLSLTSATHGAFLVQLTTLFVPIIQGLTGVPITKKMWTAVALAMSGVFLFTQGSDGTGDATLIGDALCVASALFLGLYDLSLNKWGDKVPPVTLITNKIASQAILSSGLVIAFGGSEVMDYLSDVVFSGQMSNNLLAFAAISLGNGLLVNAGASLLQVRGQNAVGPTTCQVVYATQPLMAAVLSYFFLNEQIGLSGLAGGALFVAALFLAGQPDAVSKEEVNAATD